MNTKTDDRLIAQDQCDALYRAAAYHAESDELYRYTTEIARGYIMAALATGVHFRHSDPRRLCATMEAKDIEPGSLRQMIQHTQSWLSVNGELISDLRKLRPNCTDHDLGFDLWMASNGGPGFPCSYYPEDVCARLKRSAQVLGRHALFVCNDGSVDLTHGGGVVAQA